MPRPGSPDSREDDDDIPALIASDVDDEDTPVLVSTADSSDEDKPATLTRKTASVRRKKGGSRDTATARTPMPAQNVVFAPTPSVKRWLKRQKLRYPRLCKELDQGHNIDRCAVLYDAAAPRDKHDTCAVDFREHPSAVFHVARL